MRMLKRLKGSDKALSTMVIAIVAVLVIASVGVAAYFVLSDDNGSSSGSIDFSEEIVDKGKWGIDTTFYYDIVTEDENTNYENISIYAVVEAESRAYYVVTLYIKEYLDGSSKTTQIAIFAMHKTNGSIRFATDQGSDSFEYKGENISLKKWKFTSLTAETIVSVNSESCIPYKISAASLPTLVEFGPESYSFDLELFDVDEKPAADYIERDIDQDMIQFSLSADVSGAGISAKVNGTIALAYAGHSVIGTDDDGKDVFQAVYIICIDLKIKGTLNGLSAELDVKGLDYFMFEEEDDLKGASISAIFSTLKELPIEDLEAFIKGYAEKSEATIDTPSGRKNVTVYTLIPGSLDDLLEEKEIEGVTDLRAVLYLGDDNVPYKLEAGASYAGFSISLTLTLDRFVVNYDVAPIDISEFM